MVIPFCSFTSQKSDFIKASKRFSTRFSRASLYCLRLACPKRGKHEGTKEKKRNSSFLIFYGHVPLLPAFVESFSFVFLLKGLKRHFPPSAEGLQKCLRSFWLPWTFNIAPCVHGDLILNGKVRHTEPLEIRCQAGIPFATSLFKAILWILRIMSCKLGWKLMTKFALRCSVYKKQWLIIQTTHERTHLFDFKATLSLRVSLTSV